MEFDVRLAMLEKEARDFIEAKLLQQPDIRLVEGEPGAIDDDTLDDLPAFPTYDSWGFCEYAAIQALSMTDQGIEVSVIFKGSGFPGIKQISLIELSADELITLAQYLIDNDSK